MNTATTRGSSVRRNRASERETLDIFRAVLLVNLTLSFILAAPTSAQKTHPSDAYRHTAAEGTVTVSMTLADADEEESGALGIASEDAWTAGVLNEPACEAFGVIRDVAVAPDGTVYVLDGQASEVQTFASGGTCGPRFGGQGGGPGEFRQARAVDVDDAGRVHVLDFDGRVSLFGRQEDEFILEEDFSVRLDMTEGDFCVTDEGGWAFAGRDLKGQGVLHYYSPDLEAEVRPVLGPLYTSGTAVDVRFTGGQISCLPGERVLHTAPALGEMRVVDLWTGRVDMLVRISDFQPLQIRLTERGGTQIAVPEEGYHYPVGTVSLGDGRIVVQWGLRSPEGVKARRPWDRLITFLIDPDSRTVSHLGEELPSLRAAGEGWVVVRRPGDVPGIEVRGLAGR